MKNVVILCKDGEIQAQLEDDEINALLDYIEKEDHKRKCKEVVKKYGLEDAN